VAGYPCKVCGSLQHCKHKMWAETFTNALGRPITSTRFITVDTFDHTLRLTSGNRLRLTSDGDTWRMAILPMEHAR
jgi:hypothetical protein